MTEDMENDISDENPVDPFGEFGLGHSHGEENGNDWKNNNFSCTIVDRIFSNILLRFSRIIFSTRNHFSE